MATVILFLGLQYLTEAHQKSWWNFRQTNAWLLDAVSIIAVCFDLAVIAACFIYAIRNIWPKTEKTGKIIVDG